MKQITHGASCTWAEIKKQLDPAWSYAVIETAATTPQAAVFGKVASLLAEHGASIRKQEICRETITDKLLMLVEIDPERTEAVKRSLLGPSMPPSVTVLFYNQPPRGETQGRRPTGAV